MTEIYQFKARLDDISYHSQTYDYIITTSEWIIINGKGCSI